MHDTFSKHCRLPILTISLETSTQISSNPPACSEMILNSLSSISFRGHRLQSHDLNNNGYKFPHQLAVWSEDFAGGLDR